MKRRTKIAAVTLTAALLLTAGTAGAALASGGGADSPRPAAEHAQREAAALTGTAKLYRSAGDDITFTFDAHLAAKDTRNPRRATGTFAFSHYLHGRGAWARARVDCLVTGGEVAVVSGVITASDLPGAKGRRVGVTVHDLGRHDRLGYSWAGVGSPTDTKDLPPCVSSAPFEKVKQGTGDFKVVPWQPRL
ncbi:Repetin [Streptomyces barringtoniae]|uniref:Repetin n=1 Tax=Streptomyces barringtoniae TaxID=2892029 RepID=UPI001E5BF882|nr:Repetin [Streptomyces barringtoniae]MCC5475300.1 Repetin [Streptomyces barringtoniae]